MGRPSIVARDVNASTRWSQEQAPGKAHCRRTCVQTIVDHFPDRLEPLKVLSLCGGVPHTEHQILDRRNATFDLIEREKLVLETLLPTLEYDFPRVHKVSRVYKTELLSFLKKHPQNQYDVAIFDMMGGWCPQYIAIFNHFLQNNATPDSLIFFTYNPQPPLIRDIVGQRPELVDFYPSQITERYPLELLWEHSYNDSTQRFNAMTTMAFRVRKDNLAMKGKFGPKTLEGLAMYQRLRETGWKPMHEILGRSSNGVSIYVQKALSRGIVAVDTLHQSSTGNVNPIKLFNPQDFADIKLMVGDKHQVLEAKKLPPVSVAAPTTETSQVTPLPPVTIRPTLPKALEMLKQEFPEDYRAILREAALKELQLS